MDNAPAPVKAAVLVVDDDEDILAILETSLSAHGFSVLLSHNGAHLWDIVTRNRPNIILLDVQMDGVDGVEICRRLKENLFTATIPVLMFSAIDNLHIISKGCGANGYIAKPFDLAKVKAEITEALNATR